MKNFVFVSCFLIPFFRRENERKKASFFFRKMKTSWDIREAFGYAAGSKADEKENEAVCFQKKLFMKNSQTR